MNVMVKFIADIDDLKRPLNYPKDCVAIGTYEVENTDQLINKINEEFRAITTMQGMIFQLGSMVDTTRKINVEDRIFIPMHMITSIRVRISVISGDMPRLVDGEMVDSEGKKVIKQ